MRYHSGDLLTRVIRDIGTLENFYVRTLSPPVVAVLVSLTTILFLGGFGAELSLGLAGFLILAGIVLPILVFLLSRQLGPQIIQKRAELSTLLIDGFQGMPDLLIYDQDKQQAGRLNQAGEHLTRLQARMAGLNAFQTSIISLLSNLAMLTILILAIQRVSNGQLAGCAPGSGGIDCTHLF